MHPAKMKPPISIRNIFIVGGLLTLRASTVFPSNSGGTSAISFNPIVVRMVEMSRALCWLQAILMSVCIGGLSAVGECPTCVEVPD